MDGTIQTCMVVHSVVLKWPGTWWVACALGVSRASHGAYAVHEVRCLMFMRDGMHGTHACDGFLIASTELECQPESVWLFGFPGVPSAQVQACMVDWSQHSILDQERAQIAGGNGSWVVLDFF